MIPRCLFLTVLAAACVPGKTPDSEPADTDPADPPCTWYADADGDGFGDLDAAQEAPCDASPSGTVADGTDCDDADAAIHPGAVETCDGVDQDCDGSVDENATDAGTWYSDADADGFGDPHAPVQACAPPDGTTADHSDCDDRDGEVNPAAVEVCDGLDEDCDGLADDDALGTDAACAAGSCLDLLLARPGLSDGRFWLDPGGLGEPLEAWCDMSTDGGGWTLITNVLSIGYAWTLGASLEEDFVADEAVAARIGAGATEIRYACQHPTDDIFVDLKTADPTWLVRPYSHGDACSLGYNWYPDVSGFVELPAHSYAMGAPWAVGCDQREDHLLATYPIGFDYYAWFIDDLWYVGDAVTPLCAGAAPARWMRVFYR